MEIVIAMLLIFVFKSLLVWWLASWLIVSMGIVGITFGFGEAALLVTLVDILTSKWSEE